MSHEVPPFKIGDRVVYRKRGWNPANSKLFREIIGDGRRPRGYTVYGTVVGIDITSDRPIKIEFDKDQRDPALAVGTNRSTWLPLDAIEPIPAVDRLAEIELP